MRDFNQAMTAAAEVLLKALLDPPEFEESFEPGMFRLCRSRVYTVQD